LEGEVKALKTSLIGRILSEDQALIAKYVEECYEIYGGSSVN